MISIIDCGLERLRHLVGAFSMIGCQVNLVRLPSEVERASHLVLAGQTSFIDTMRELESKSLAAAIQQAVTSGKPFLGIGAGMHVLFDACSEAPEINGLGLIPGAVEQLHPSEAPAVNTGWCKLNFIKRPLLTSGLADNPLMFFNHHQYVIPEDPDWTMATFDYEKPLPAIVGRDKLFGVQFHPEHSKQAGYSLLKAFGDIDTDS